MKLTIQLPDGGEITGDLTSETVADRVRALSDAEQAYVARWVAVTHPGIAGRALEALARYRAGFPGQARAFLGEPS